MSGAAPAGAVDRGPENRWRVLAVLSAALLLVVVDVTVLHVAAPAIAEDLRPSSTALLWTIDVYPLVVAPLLVAAGTVGDRWGRRRTLIVGLVWFTVASALAAFAWSPGVLIAARALQGVGGALIMPSTMSIIRAVFPDRQERVRAIGIWSAVLSGGGVAGPLVGGFLVEHLWWGAVFLINVPILLLVLPFALRVLPESRHSDPPPWDARSVVLVGAGVLLLAFGIKHGARHGVDAPTVASAVVAVAALVAFGRRQLRAARPLLDLRLFAEPVFAVAAASVLLVMFAFVGLELFFSQYLQLVLGLGPLEASVRLLPLIGASVVGSLAGAPVLRRLGARAVMPAGLAIAAVALVPLLWVGTADRYLLLAVPFVVLGLALQVALLAANDTILSAVSADDAGQAAAIEETGYELGGGIGVAVLGAIGTGIYTGALGTVRGVSAADLDAAGGSITEAVSVAERLPAAVAEPLLAAARDAFVVGFHGVTVAAIALVALAAVLAAAVLRRGARPAAG
ncbi:MFS transporter [Patulibacter sp. SYSU D01012]|uniref:MFS transporter n=1 Tax=Patulibacter sp. SYSU D01012 TaxID=2817381 RepID=UPI001B31320A